MSFMSTTRGGDGSDERREEQPRVVVIQDREIHRMRLVDLLRQRQCNVIEVLLNAKLPDDIENMDASPGLFVFPIDGADPTSLKRIRAVHSHAEFCDVPILGVARMKDLRVGLDALRDLGVVGVADIATTGEHLAFRVEQLLRPELQRRRWERFDVFLPIEFELDGVCTTELALSLSMGGIGLRCSRKVDVNADVRVTFDSGDATELSLDGRIVQSTDDPRAVPRNRVALVFYPTDEATTARLERVVTRARPA